MTAKNNTLRAIQAETGEMLKKLLEKARDKNITNKSQKTTEMNPEWGGPVQKKVLHSVHIHYLL